MQCRDEEEAYTGSLDTDRLRWELLKSFRPDYNYSITFKKPANEREKKSARRAESASASNRMGDPAIPLGRAAAERIRLFLNIF